MPEQRQLQKARLIELEHTFENVKSGGKDVTVQFNPDSLKVTFANQIATPSGSGDQRGTPARLFVGAGTTKLAVVLWFDVYSPQPQGARNNDVRDLTKDVAFFITPQKEGDKFIPPALRFLWGSFSFDGIVEGMEETLELFSPEGKPLRAQISFTLSQQKIQPFTGAGGTLPGIAGSPGGPKTPGTKPLARAPQGSSVQQMSSNQGGGSNWQPVAEANGIENPRALVPGQLIDLNAKVKVGIGGS